MTHNQKRMLWCIAPVIALIVTNGVLVLCDVLPGQFGFLSVPLLAVQISIITHFVRKEKNVI